MVKKTIKRQDTHNCVLERYFITLELMIPCQKKILEVFVKLLRGFVRASIKLMRPMRKCGPRM